jgi:hypothetical protein
MSRNLSRILNTLRKGGLYPSIGLTETRTWEARISYGRTVLGTYVPNADVVIAQGDHPTDALAQAYYKLSEDIRAKVEELQ